MGTVNIILLVVVGIAAIALLIFLIKKNQKDKDTLNPDANEIVEEIHGDKERRSESN